MGKRKLPKWAKSEAMRQDYLDRCELQDDPHGEELYLRAQLRVAGYIVGEKAEYTGKNLWLKKFSRFTTVFPVGDMLGGPNIVALRHGWGSDPAGVGKVAVLRHEMVHVRQSKSMGPWLFAVRYLWRRPWRWALEVQAYRQSIMVMVLAQVPRTDLLRKIDLIAKTLRGSYSLGAFDSDEIERETLKALMTEVR